MNIIGSTSPALDRASLYPHGNKIIYFRSNHLLELILDTNNILDTSSLSHKILVNTASLVQASRSTSQAFISLWGKEKMD